MMMPLSMFMLALLGQAQATDLQSGPEAAPDEGYEVLVEDTRTGLIRDLNGQHVRASQAGTVVLFFSIHDTEASGELLALSDLARRGHNVLAVNVDSCAQRAHITPYLRRIGIRNVPAAQDPAHTLSDSVSAHAGDAVLLQYDRGTRVLWRSPDLHAASEALELASNAAP